MAQLESAARLLNAGGTTRPLAQRRYGVHPLPRTTQPCQERLQTAWTVKSSTLLACDPGDVNRTHRVATPRACARPQGAHQRRRLGLPSCRKAALPRRLQRRRSETASPRSSPRREQAASCEHCTRRRAGAVCRAARRRSGLPRRSAVFRKSSSTNYSACQAAFSCLHHARTSEGGAASSLCNTLQLAAASRVRLSRVKAMMTSAARRAASNATKSCSAVWCNEGLSTCVRVTRTSLHT